MRLTTRLAVIVPAALVTVLAGAAGCDPVKEVIEDPENVIHKAQIDENGKPFNYEQMPLPDDAFTKEEIKQERKDDEVDVPVPTRIHPALEALLNEDPEKPVAVIILLQDDVQIPRFPDLPKGVMRDTPEAEPYEQMTDELIRGLMQQRDESTKQFLAAAGQGGIPLAVEEQFWLISGFMTEVLIGDLKPLLAIDQLTYIQPQFNAEPPPDADPDNDIADGRARIVSDPYFNLGQTFSYIGLLDTGIRPTHTLFNGPSNVDFVVDCVNGGPNCFDSSQPGWDPTDFAWDHGTSSAAIIVANNTMGGAYRGTTAITLDSFQIYTGAGLNTAAAVRAFQRGLQIFDRVFVGEIQANEGENGAIALAADAAFDANAVVVAANGNFGPGAGTVRSPGLAHKVLGIGAYDVVSEDQYASQGLGPAPDGRYKPELQAPNNTESASNASDNALQTFGGTSGATPYGAGAAALMRNWLIDLGTNDMGHAYAHMINCGTLAWPSFDNTRGVGPLEMPVNGWVWWGKVSISDGTVVNIPITFGAGVSDLRAALWWPEAQTEAHDDVDVHLIDPSGAERARSYSGISIFERARVPGAVTAGTWKIRIKGYNVQSGPQTVYWVVDVHN